MTFGPKISRKEREKRRYRADGEYRAKKLKSNAEYQLKRMATDPTFIKLTELRKRIYKVRESYKHHTHIAQLRLNELAKLLDQKEKLRGSREATMPRMRRNVLDKQSPAPSPVSRMSAAGSTGG